MERLEQLAGISVEGPGVSRCGYGPHERRAHELVADWMRAADLVTHGDSAGNLHGRLEGRDPSLPPVWVGSHLDSVPSGGMLDGVYGVVGGLAAVTALAQEGPPERSVEVVAFACEESARFGAGLLGSRGVVYGWTAAELDGLVDANGVKLREAVTQVHLDPERVRTASVEPRSLHCYIELHIEQGPVLEQAGTQLGVVTAIAAPTYLRALVAGQAGHAGTTPMVHRRDALPGASEIVLAIERIARNSGRGAVATVGAMHVHPGASNVIPGRVEFSIDVRALDRNQKAQLVAEILSAGGEIAAARSLTWSAEVLAELTPVSCDGRIQAVLRNSATEVGATSMDLPSGAYHDAMTMSAVCPIGMLFVPSVGGRSHVPDEHTEPLDLERGVTALTRALWKLSSADGLDLS